MAYDSDRSYISANVPAQSLVSTASGAVVTNTNATQIPIAEATFVCSIAGVVVSSSGSQASTIKYAVLSGTTTLGSITPGSTQGAVAFSSVSPNVAVGSGVALSVSVIGTGTASATQTASQINLIVGVAPQYV